MKLIPSFFGKGKALVEKAVTNPLQIQDIYGYVREIFTGSWQRNISKTKDTQLRYSAVFSCISLIGSDIAKLSLIVLTQSTKGNWTLSRNLPALMKRPNKYQTWQKFVEAWIHSLLTAGNAYIYKIMDNGRLVELHVLNPHNCTPAVTDEGEIYYALQRNDLARQLESNYVPASTIIHDRINCFYHPLVGLSPIFACGTAADQGLSIQANSTAFFDNMSRPSGILSAPGTIKKDTAERLKVAFEENYSQNNIGRIAVLGDGLVYHQLALSAADSQLMEQLKWTAETVCSCFHVPMFKINVGNLPANANAEMLNQIYYSDCLQSLITSVETNINELGLLPVNQTFKFDIRDLVRMDTYQKYESLGKGVKDGWLKPDEARAEVYLESVPGGDTPYMQQQNYSLRALALRDETNPLSVQNTNPPAEPTTPQEPSAPVRNELAPEVLFVKELMELVETEIQLVSG
jgi:HK97 family phage portal protein